MNRQDGFDRLDFDDKFVFDKQIHAVPERDRDVFVNHRKRLFGFERQTKASQLITHARYVRLLQQTRTRREWILYAALSTLFVMFPCTSLLPCFPFVSVSSVVLL